MPEIRFLDKMSEQAQKVQFWSDIDRNYSNCYGNFVCTINVLVSQKLLEIVQCPTVISGSDGQWPTM